MHRATDSQPHFPPKAACVATTSANWRTGRECEATNARSCGAERGALHQRPHLMSEMRGRNRGRYALEEGITGRALAHKQLIIVQHLDEEPARAAERRNPWQQPGFLRRHASACGPEDRRGPGLSSHSSPQSADLQRCDDPAHPRDPDRAIALFDCYTGTENRRRNSVTRPRRGESANARRWSCGPDWWKMASRPSAKDTPSQPPHPTTVA